jgi:hypothetical protein
MLKQIHWNDSMPALLVPSLHVVQSLVVGDNPASVLPVAPEGRPIERLWVVTNEADLEEKGPCFDTARLENPSRGWRVKADGALFLRIAGQEPGTPVRVVLDYETPLERARRLNLPLFDPSVHVIHRITAGNQHRNALPEPPPGRKLERIWTVIDESLLKQIGPGRNTAFPEDEGHDWLLNPDGTLRFFSRVVEMNQEADVVLDYQTAAEMNERMRLPRFDPQTGQPLGRPAAPEAVEAPAPRAPRPR